MTKPNLLLSVSLCSVLLAACGEPQKTNNVATQAAAPSPVVAQETKQDNFVPPRDERKIFLDSLVEGKEYVFYGKTGSKCKNDDKTVCLNEAQYSMLCLSNNGVTKWGSRMLFAPRLEDLRFYENNDVSDISVDYISDSNYKLKCRVEETVRGIQDGSSKKITRDGGVRSFILKSSEVLIHEVHSRDWGDQYE